MPSKRELEKKMNDIRKESVVQDELGRVVDRLDENKEVLEQIKEAIKEPAPIKIDHGGLQFEVKVPEGLKIDNFPETQKVEVVNHPELPKVQKVEVVNLPEAKPTPAPIVNIPDQVSIKEPSWFNLEPIKKALADVGESIKKHVFSVRVVDDSPRQVVLVDERGKPANLQPIVNVPPPISPFNYGGQGFDKVKITNPTTSPVPVTLVGGSASDGAIVDGADSGIKATVLDYTGSNPVAVRLTDTNGDYVSAGAGTQYTEDAAAAADPIGNAQIVVRADSLAAVTDTDGDNIALRGTNKGELYVKHADTIAVTQSGTWDEVGINDSGNSITVDNNGTFATQVDGAALTALQLIDDTVYVDDADWTDSTSKHVLVGGLYQSTPQTVTDGDVAPFNITASGAMHVAVQSMPTTTVQATNLDVRDLTSASDSVAVLQATHDNLNLNANVQVGNADASASNPVPVEEEGHGAVGTVIDTVTAAGTAEQFASQACKRMIVTALPNNTGVVAIGDANVVAALDETARGVLLFATQSQQFFVTNTNLLYVDASVSGEGVTYYYEN